MVLIILLTVFNTLLPGGQWLASPPDTIRKEVYVNDTISKTVVSADTIVKKIYVKKNIIYLSDTIRDTTHVNDTIRKTTLLPDSTWMNKIGYFLGAYSTPLYSPNSFGIEAGYQMKKFEISGGLGFTSIMENINTIDTNFSINKIEFYDYIGGYQLIVVDTFYSIEGPDTTGIYFGTEKVWNAALDSTLNSQDDTTSEITNKDENYKLRLIEIPISFSYSFYQSPRVKLSILGGVITSFVISNETGSKSDFNMPFFNIATGLRGDIRLTKKMDVYSRVIYRKNIGSVQKESFPQKDISYFTLQIGIRYNL